MIRKQSLPLQAKIIIKSAVTLNFSGHLTDCSSPRVMGILNVTPDSFYAASRAQEETAIRERAAQILSEGAAIIDVGAYSSRPGAAEVSEEQEMQRLDMALSIIRQHFPEALVSVDTFRSEVARHCVRDFGVQLINDVSGGLLDDKLFETVAELQVPYVLTHSGGLADAPVSASDTFVEDLCRFFAERLQQLYALGVADVILDPGFGFGKTLEQNYQLMHRLADIIGLFPDNAFLVGVSRKSMIYRLLGTTPEESLNGTTVLHTIALQAGAHFLRVHDVREAVETTRIIGQLNKLQLDNCKIPNSESKL